MKGSASIIATLLILVVVAVCAIIFALNVLEYDVKAELSASEAKVGYVEIYAAKIDPQVLTVFLYGIGQKVSEVYKLYLLDPSGNIVCTYTFPEALVVKPGELMNVSIPLMLFSCSSDIPPRGYIGVLSSSGLSKSTQVYDFSLITVRGVTIGLLFDTDSGDTDTYDNSSLSVSSDTSKHKYLLLTLSGSYLLKDTSGQLYSGRVKVYLNTSEVSVNEAAQYGPAIVVVNPYKGAATWTLRIVKRDGSIITILVDRIVNDPNVVLADVLILIEDLWPGDYDNYIDHVVRVTIFTNDTARIQVLKCSGDFLHAFYMNIKFSTDSFATMFSEAIAFLQALRDRTFDTSRYPHLLYIKPHKAVDVVVDSATGNTVNVQTYVRYVTVS